MLTLDKLESDAKELIAQIVSGGEIPEGMIVTLNGYISGPVWHSPTTHWLQINEKFAREQKAFVSGADTIEEVLEQALLHNDGDFRYARFVEANLKFTYGQTTLGYHDIEASEYPDYFWTESDEHFVIPGDEWEEDYDYAD